MRERELNGTCERVCRCYEYWLWNAAEAEADDPGMAPHILVTARSALLATLGCAAPSAHLRSAQ